VVRLNAGCTARVRFADVEVKNAVSHATLATGDTKQDGTFDLQFSNPTGNGSYVMVTTKQDNEIVKQEVKDKSDNLYGVRSTGAIDDVAVPDKTGLEVKALAAADGPAPAFNIFDVGVTAAQFSAA
jgi:hypothetical protein